MQVALLALIPPFVALLYRLSGVPGPGGQRFVVLVALFLPVAFLVIVYAAALSASTVDVIRGLHRGPILGALGLAALLTAGIFLVPPGVNRSAAIWLYFTVTPLPDDADWVRLYDGGALWGSGYFVRARPAEDSGELELRFGDRYSIPIHPYEADGVEKPTWVGAWPSTVTTYAWHASGDWWYVYHDYH